MQGDIWQQYQQIIDESHHGHPTIIESHHDGGFGRPYIHIDRTFLEWAYSLRSTTSIAHYLGLSRRLVRQRLLDYGIAQPREQPYTLTPQYRNPTGENNSVPNPLLLTQDGNPDEYLANPDSITEPAPISSYTGPVSNLSDDDLDGLLLRLRRHFRRAGITMFDGMLRRLGHRVPRERIRQSLIRIDPVHRVFQRIQIRRRKYNVPGPNSLWHHDGQHGKLITLQNSERLMYCSGLIRWGIVIHGFIDGYSRLITALRAHNNNRAQTVLDLFLSAIAQFAVPSRVRGDHGLENLFVAAWMEQHMGFRRGSYIWGR